ncbi:MAG: TonB-dependent receptor [Gemmatimonadota bacterium]
MSAVTPPRTAGRPAASHPAPTRGGRWGPAPALLWGLLLVVLAGAAGARTGGSVQGQVADAESGEPLAGANVQIPGTVLGAITDRDGRFALVRVPAGRQALRISMIGYATQIVAAVEVPAGGAVAIRAELWPAAIALDLVVVTAQRRPERLEESTTSVAVLPFSEIAARNSLRLDEALEMVPGVCFTQDDVSIRGSTGYRANSGSRVLLLVDGIPVMTGDTGGIGWDMLPMLDIERVEVVKGAGSAVWGSHAIGGVINVITRRPSQEGALAFRATGGLFDAPSEKLWAWAPHGTLGYARTEVSYSRALGPTALRLSGSRYASTSDRRDGGFAKWNLSGKATHRFSDAAELELYLAWLRDRSGVFVQWRSPFVADSTDVGPTQLFHPLLPQDEGNELRLTWLDGYLKYSRPLSARSHLRLRLSVLRSMLGNQFDVTDAFSPAVGPGGEVQMDWVPAPGHFVTAGAEARVNIVEGKYFGGRHREYATAPFAQEEWQVRPDLRLSAGLRFDRHELAGGPVDQQLSPRFGLNFQPRPQVALRASAGRGFRAPTVAERTMRFGAGGFVVVSRADLRPESSWSWEGGVRRSFGRAAYVDAAVYQNDYHDFIEPLTEISQTATDIVVSFQNVADARVRGFEVASSWRGGRERLRLDGSLTLMDSRDLESGAPLTYRPRWIGQVTPALQLGRLELRADYRFASRLQRVAIYTDDQRVAQHELNLRVQYRGRDLALTVGVDNALNYNYTQLERNLGPIRSFSAGLSGSL